MRFQRVVPPGDAGSPEGLYTGLSLGERAGRDRPYVVCNFVSSADGKATAGGRTAALGGDGDRAAFHLLRTQVDAVLAGTGTLRTERYGVLVRDAHLTEIRLADGRAAQPLAVVVSRSGDIPFDIPLFSDAGSRVALYLPSTVAVPDCAADVHAHGLPGDESDLRAVMSSLRREHDVRALLCEGGPALFNAMLAQDLVDELFLTLAPILVGGRELGVTTGPALPNLQPLRLIRALEREGHLFLRYRAQRS